ncbi:MAG: plastocyanin/azurin family copper-binding protein [Nitrososphaeraceae archaeon]
MNIKSALTIVTIVAGLVGLAVTVSGTRNLGMPHVFAAEEKEASIVSGASTLADKAYSPNPINIKTGDTVKWKNDDTMFHTVTSGSGPNDSAKGKEFDSALSGPNALTTKGKEFSHTFAKAGDFPYYCQLHPTMIGKVVVS